MAYDREAIRHGKIKVGRQCSMASMYSFTATYCYSWHILYTRVLPFHVQVFTQNLNFDYHTSCGVDIATALRRPGGTRVDSKSRAKDSSCGVGCSCSAAITPCLLHQCIPANQKIEVTAEKTVLTNAGCMTTTCEPIAVANVVNRPMHRVRFTGKRAIAARATRRRSSSSKFADVSKRERSVSVDTANEPCVEAGDSSTVLQPIAFTTALHCVDARLDATSNVALLENIDDNQYDQIDPSEEARCAAAQRASSRLPNTAARIFGTAAIVDLRTALRLVKNITRVYGLGRSSRAVDSAMWRCIHKSPGAVGNRFDTSSHAQLTLGGLPTLAALYALHGAYLDNAGD